ncbi:5-(carboxyamino)imidazole ribonucleotide synthase, partial [Rhizobium ruizarguesonis]
LGTAKRQASNGDDILAVPDWLRSPDTLVHLYGKTDWRPGRKMGHVTTLTPKSPVLA